MIIFCEFMNKVIFLLDLSILLDYDFFHLFDLLFEELAIQLWSLYLLFYFLVLLFSYFCVNIFLLFLFSVLFFLFFQLPPQRPYLGLILVQRRLKLIDLSLRGLQFLV